MTDVRQNENVSRLKEEIIRLGPWHLDVQVTPEVSTRAFLEAPEGTYSGEKDPRRVSFINPKTPFENLLRRVYPEGLGGRRFLECACNCGAYCFWAKEMGASETFGFDVRDHWIDQANFLKANRTVGPTDGMRFERADLYDLPGLGLEPFDVTLFQGIFYHLPDPVTGLKAAADLTKELLVVDTGIRTDLPDGALAVASEGTAPVMTGVYGLNWFPTGPEVLTRMLRWMGFKETWVAHWREQRRPGRGRLRILASREEGLLSGFESAERPVGVEETVEAVGPHFAAREVGQATGVVVEAEPGRRRFSLRPEGEAATGFRFNPEKLRVTLGGTPVGPEEIKEGRRAEVAYVMRKDRRFARSVDLRS